MANNIKAFPGKQDPLAMLEMAKHWELQDVLIVGWTEDGAFVWGTSTDSMKEVAWMAKNLDVSLTQDIGAQEDA